MPQKFTLFVCFCFVLPVYNVCFAQQPKLMLPIGHTESIRYAQFSPDGKKIVTASDDKTAKLWDVETGKLLIDLKGHKQAVISAQFSPDGNKIITASNDSTARIWDAVTGEHLTTLTGNNAILRSAQFSSDGKKILTVAFEDSAKIWDAESGVLLKALKENNQGFYSAQFSPDGKKILTTSGDSTIKVWDAATGELFFKSEKQKGYISTAQFSSDGNKILTTWSDGKARIFDAGSGNLLRNIIVRKPFVLSNTFTAQFSPDGKKIITSSENTEPVIIWDAVSGIALDSLSIKKNPSDFTRDILAQFSPDGKTIVTISKRESAKLWDAATGNFLSELKGDYNYASEAHFSPDGKNLVTIIDNTTSATEDKIAKIWDVETGKISSVLKGHTFETYSVRFGPDGEKLIAVTGEDKVRAWDVATGSLSAPLINDTSGIINLFFSPDYKKAATISKKMVITEAEESEVEILKIWNVATGKLITELKGEEVFGGLIQFSPDGKKIVTLSSDNMPHSGFNVPILWDANTGKRLAKLEGHFMDIRSVQFRHDGKKLVTSSLDVSVKIWDVATGKLLKNITAFNGQLESAQFSPDGKKILAIAYDSVARIFDAVTGTLLVSFKGHSENITSDQFSPDGKKVITASEDSTVKIWDVATGKLLYDLKGHKDAVSSTKFSPDAKKILSYSGSSFETNNIIKIWDTPSGSLLFDLTDHNGNINDAAFSPDGKYIFSASKDNTIKKWDVVNGKCLFTFFAVDKDGYLVVDNNNHFDGTKAAIDLLYFTCNTEIVDLKQAKETLYIPGLTKLINNGESINTKTLGELNLCGLTPDVDVSSSNAGDFSFKIKPRRGGIGTTELFINGKMLSSYQPEDLDKSGDGFELKIKKEKLIPFLPDPVNNISVKAYTDADHNSVPSREVFFTVNNSGPPPPPPNLYAVMVGVSDYKSADMHLNYAAIDANDMSNALGGAAKKLLGNDHVFMYNLTTAEKHDLLPYKKNIKQVFDSIGIKAAANDILLIFLSGHGVTRKKDNQFYYMTAEAASLEEESISSDFGISTAELTDWMKLENIKAQKRILIMDACYSGQAINDFVKLGSSNQGFLAAKGDDNWQQKKAIESLNDQSGMIILSASSSAQLSWESKAYSHGYLTYSLLLAIKQSIPGNTLDVSEWFGAAKKTVIEVSKKWGAPQEPQFIPSTNFPIGMVDNDVMTNIKLPEEKQLFIPGNFQNDDTTADGDNLLLGRKIDESLNEISSTVADSKIVFLLASSSAEACMLSGRYAVKGNIVTVRVSIKKNNQRKYRFDEKGTKDKLPDLAKRIADKAAEWVSDNISNNN